MVGPGVGRAIYGGCMMIYPPRPIPDIWKDPRIHMAQTLEEKILEAAFFHSQEKHITVVTPCLPKSSWRRLARIDFADGANVGGLQPDNPESTPPHAVPEVRSLNKRSPLARGGFCRPLALGKKAGQSLAPPLPRPGMGPTGYTSPGPRLTQLRSGH